MKKQAGVQSVDRVFDLIELLSMHPRGIRLVDIEEQTGLHKSTAHRLLGALMARGYATQDEESKKYRLTLRLFELSGRVVDDIDVLEVARTPLEQLRNDTGEAVHLVVREKRDIVYIHKVESSRSGIRMFSRVGMRRPMYCTAVGKAILATLEIEKVKEIWEATTIRQYTDYTITSLEDLLKELERIRVVGYALDNEENELGVRCIATSVPDYTGHSHAAFSLSAPVVRMSDQRIEELAPVLLEARQKIGDGLGYLPR